MHVERTMLIVIVWLQSANCIKWPDSQIAACRLQCRCLQSGTNGGQAYRQALGRFRRACVTQVNKIHTCFSGLRAV